MIEEPTTREHYTNFGTCRIAPRGSRSSLIALPSVTNPDLTPMSPFPMGTEIWASRTPCPEWTSGTMEKVVDGAFDPGLEEVSPASITLLGTWCAIGIVIPAAAAPTQPIGVKVQAMTVQTNKGWDQRSHNREEFPEYVQPADRPDAPAPDGE